MQFRRVVTLTCAGLLEELEKMTRLHGPCSLRACQLHCKNICKMWFDIRKNDLQNEPKTDNSKFRKVTGYFKCKNNFTYLGPGLWCTGRLKVKGS